MMNIFISAKEGELNDERAMAIYIVKHLGLNAIASENRPALSMSIREWYKKEVLRSDIYVGIFGHCYSDATIEEFELARPNIPVLLFEKEMYYNEKRDPDLETFLDDVKHGRRNVVVSKYKNAVDLKNKIKDAIIQTLSREYFECRERMRKHPTEIETEYPAELATGKELVKLGFGKIIKFEFPESTGKEQIRTRVEFQGTVRYGFLDVMIRTSDGIKYWIPDPKSWDGRKDLGTLILEDKTHNSSWVFSLPEHTKSGRSQAFMGMYEDTVDLPTRNRRLVDYKIREFTIV